MDENEAKAEAFWPTMVEFLFATRDWWVALCAEFDLTPAQGHALRALDPARPVPMSTLAEALLCDASNVTGIVDRLEKRGLIERQPSVRDRRVKVLVVTAEGANVRRQLLIRLGEPPQAFAALSSADRKRLAGILRRALSRAAAAPAR
jgi:MarR family transcriptional regulator, organic hydroperoxide resistance regulator